MTDLSLGLFYNVLHGTSKSKKAKELTSIIAPVYEKISEGKSFRQSYFRRIDFDFFPKEKISTEDNLENQKMGFDSFYKNRKAAFFNSEQQMELF